jgi:general L-amino acid transport system permease protein
MTELGLRGQGAEKPSQRSFFYDPALRGFFYQALLVAGIGFFGYEAFVTGRANMQARGIPTDFAFWNNVAGFDISQTLIDYSALSTYGRAFWVGLLNTLLVAVIGIFFATILGFAIGIARLSKNWIVARLATVYVETLRNLPLLLQLLFWYQAVLKALPTPRESLVLLGSIYLNNRGLVVPQPVFGENAFWVVVVTLIGIVAAFLYGRWRHARLMRTGQEAPLLPVVFALVLGLPALVAILAGQFVSFQLPELKGFNFRGGLRLLPELVALLLGLILYTASFIAEIVRAGIQAVPRGQIEAAQALGLHNNRVLRLVTIPQAMRLIIPPLTSQYLNLTKNSSLAVFIAYPDLVQVFMGTVLNQTGAAVQVVAITMLVYLTISLLTSLVMNLYNRRIIAKEARA